MLRKALFLSALLTSSAWSLTFSEPYEICRAKGYELQALFRNDVGINDRGDIALAWEEEGVLKLAEKPSGATEFSHSIIPEYIADFDTLEWCSVDSDGNAQIFWENDDDEFIVAKKTRGQPFSQLDNLGEHYNIELKPSYEIVIVDADYLDNTYDLRVTLKNLETSECTTQILGEIPSDFLPIYLKDPNEFLFFGMHNSNGFDLYFTKKIGGDEWSEPECIPVAWPSYHYPDVFVDSKENIYIVSESYQHGLLSLSRVGGVWSEVETVALPLDLESLRVEMDSRGNLMAVWVMGVESRVVYAAYKPSGKPWGKPTALSSSNEQVIEPLKLGADELGRFVVLWNGQCSWCDLRIQAMTFATETETWSPAFRIAPDENMAHLTSFELRLNGRGAVSYITLGDAFGGALSVVEFSLD